MVALACPCSEAGVRPEVEGPVRDFFCHITQFLQKILVFISSQITIFLFMDEELTLLVLLYVIKPVLSSENSL